MAEATILNMPTKNKCPWAQWGYLHRPALQNSKDYNSPLTRRLSTPTAGFLYLSSTPLPPPLTIACFIVHFLFPHPNFLLSASHWRGNPGYSAGISLILAVDFRQQVHEQPPYIPKSPPAIVIGKRGAAWTSYFQSFSLQTVIPLSCNILTYGFKDTSASF